MNILAENVYALHRNMMMDVDEGKRVELLEALQASSMWSTCTSHEYAHAKTRLKFADLVSGRGGLLAGSRDEWRRQEQRASAQGEQVQDHGLLGGRQEAAGATRSVT